TNDLNSGSFTVFVVAKATTNASSYSLGMFTWYAAAGAGGFALNSDGGSSSTSKIPHITTFNSGGTETQNKKMGTSWTVGTPYLGTWTYNGTTVVGRSDGAGQTLTTSDGGYGTTQRIGVSFTTFSGYLGALIVYNSVLSADDITAV